jgi:hypothetical protein
LAVDGEAIGCDDDTFMADACYADRITRISFGYGIAERLPWAIDVSNVRRCEQSPDAHNQGGA